MRSQYGTFLHTNNEVQTILGEEEPVSIASKKAALQQVLEQTAMRLAEYEKYPETDPFEDGTVIKFDKKWYGSSGWYTYVGIRFNGEWYLTDNRQKRTFTWDELVAFMGSGVQQVYVASHWDLAIGQPNEEQVVQLEAFKSSSGLAEDAYDEHPNGR